ncbi:MAG TPA: phosphoenolpyruvate--protein phosphotransferase [Anaerolineaceae bacterium]|nr:phosphoenolpyruvate--protein phosphotransferase [Anaerolineaceae bacterium]
MVGMVIVSHSRALANSLVELVRQVANTSIPLAVAAGVGPDRSEFGTDAVEIMEAIQSVYSSDGVVVLMDLGSAVLSAQTALDLLPPEIASAVHFCAAPIVEGSIAAAVQIGLGSDAQAVCQEAMQALQPKQEQLGIPTETVNLTPPVILPPEDTLKVELTLKNLHGLHARPAARFVQTAASFDAKIQVSNSTSGKGPVLANSLNGLATLGARKGDKIIILASGKDAQKALDALAKLVDDNFGEPLEEVSQPLPVQPILTEGKTEDGLLQAVPVSEGIAIGPIVYLRPPKPIVTQELTNDPEKSWGHLQQAINQVLQSVREQRNRVAKSLGETQAAIFDAHLLILQDPELLEKAHELITQQKLNEAAAWEQEIKKVEKSYSDLDDPYLRQRAADITDLGDQVLNALAGKSLDEKIIFDKPSILFSSELTPTQTAQLDMENILGLITIAGGPTSHSAILARSMGIPAVAGASPILENLSAGSIIALDGFTGKVWPSPTPDQMAQLQSERQVWLAKRAELLKSGHRKAVTLDGHQVEVAANVGNITDTELAVKNGAEGVGLLRTEFLFLTRQTPPDEKEQYESLAAIAKRMGSLPVVVRTLDVGGDKELPYIHLAPEANPFLGVRAVRLSFQEPNLFKSQLKAILRAGAEGNFRIMFPMIASIEEIILAKQYVEDSHKELLEQGVIHQWPIQTGIMVEIPSAAVLSEVLAPQVDFFSIGTNDLTQYTLAAERGNPALAHLSDALHPAVLTLIKKVVDAAHRYGKWVGVCGELAGDPVAAPVLVGLGVDELSLNPAGIPRIKTIVRDLNFAEAMVFADKILSTCNADEARSMAKAEAPIHSATS